MLTLGIHTAGPACDVALVRDNVCVAQGRAAMVRGQDARLPGLLKSLLAEGGVTLSQVDRFGVVTGPGSFTGIRVGVAFARGLALATDKPCVGVTTMEATLPEGQQGSALVALSAQKRPPDVTFWVQTFRTGMATKDASEMSLSDLQRFLRDRPHMLFGDLDELQKHFPDCPIQGATPDAVRAAQIAATLDPALRRAQATYARQPDATRPPR